MKTIIIILISVVAFAAPAALTNAPTLIVLNDQFDAPQTLQFPTTNITVLTIADKKGSDQIAGWVAPLKKKYAERIDIRGIADVSTVPKVLRGTVRKAFRNQQSYPVMMDWSGDTVKDFEYLPERANLYLLDRDGRILKHAAGEVGEAKLKKFSDAIDSALAVPTTVTTNGAAAKQRTP